MPNWCANIVKMFVPDEDIAMAAIRALGKQGVDMDLDGTDEEDKDSKWFDFNRIIPFPTELIALDALSQQNEYKLAQKLVGSSIEMGIPHLRRIDEDLLPEPLKGHDPTRDEIMAYLKASDPITHGLYERIKAADIAHGASTWYDWNLLHWSTKWNSCHTRKPVIDDAQIHDAYHDQGETVVISWRFDTAWSPPVNIAEKLTGACVRQGFGLKWYYSPEDGGSRWNPDIDEWETVWEELDGDIGCVPEELSETEKVLRYGGEIDFQAKDED